MAERRRLGRGLESLIPDMPPEGEAPTGVRELPLRLIELNPEQPRQDIDMEELERLADSIRTSGVIQPVVVRPSGEMYELVVGERRVRASQMAGLEAVPALVRDVPDDKMLEIALVENIQRADLNAIDKAKGIRRMMADLSLTQEQAGQRLSMDRSTVANLLRLLDLSGDLQDMVSRGTLTAGHARALLAVDHEGVRARMARAVVAKGMSVRQTERLAAERSGRADRIRRPSPNVVELEDGLSKALGTRVQVKPARKGGKIVIHFNDNADFERLYEAITGRSTMAYDERVPA